MEKSPKRLSDLKDIPNKRRDIGKPQHRENVNSSQISQ